LKYFVVTKRYINDFSLLERRGAVRVRRQLAKTRGIGEAVFEKEKGTT